MIQSAVSADSPHQSVMLAEVLNALSPAPAKRMIDATFGAGGYSRALLEAGAEVLALDRDPSVKEYAETLRAEFGGRFRFVGSVFADMESALPAEWVGAVDGIVFDLGVSSMQLDQAERGFSFMRSGPLDMRMSQAERSAADLVNDASETELADIIYEYGEERQSRAIARAIVKARTEAPIESTLQLAEIVARVVRRSRDGIHPATRTFQALRIWVNDELGQLEAGLEAAERILKAGGVLVVVSFHSLEDRIVKRFLTDRTGGTGVSRHVPEAHSQKPTFRLVHRKAVAASEEESRRNARARSAKLRAAVKLEAA